VLSGEKLIRREPKIPYKGAAGVPIREEIVSRHGETIITRNAYGARCLNTPNVLFADVRYLGRRLRYLVKGSPLPPVSPRELTDAALSDAIRARR